VDIIGNSASGYRASAGGINCGSNSNLVLNNVTISGNTAVELGGGIFISFSDPIFNNVVINENNVEDNGGGIYCRSSNLNMTDVEIYQNNSDYGAGIYCNDNSNPTLSNVTITENSAVSEGGGIYWENSSATFDSIHRSNIFLNSAQLGYDLYADECPIIDVIVDTFTILYPNDFIAFPVDNFTFDILHSKIEQVNHDLYVSPTGSNSNSGLTADDPLLTIFYALMKIIADSTNPHTIYLANGTYSPSQTGENFPIYCRSYLSFQGEDKSATILDGEQSGSIFYCYNDSCFSIEDITIQNGSAVSGGGIYCYSSNPNLVNITLNGNNATFGGGIYCEYYPGPSINNVTISGNSANNGGGIYCYSCSAIRLTNANISGNSALIGGGGICCYFSSPSLYNVTITENTANDGGGIHCDYFSTPSMSNVIISGNSASYGGGIYCCSSSPNLNNVTLVENIADANGGGIYCEENATPILNNVIITGNSASGYYGFGGGIYCMNNSSPGLSGVIISENSATTGGGGLYIWNSIPVFDSTNRCNIFLNSTQSEFGHDLYAEKCLIINVILDTFTVLYPTDYFAFPVDNFTFDILHSKIEQVNQDLYVSPTGSNSNSGLTPDDPLLTITFALIKIVSDSTNPNTIHLANGTYSLSQTGETFPIHCKNYVSLEGENQFLTILDAEGQNHILYCNNDSCFSIKNLTVQNGNADYGGGIYCVYSNMTIDSVMFVGNSAKNGGGLYCEYSDLDLTNVRIRANDASAGGGLYCQYCSPNLTNVRINENTADWSGAGIYCGYSTSPHLLNVTITDNSTSTNYGGGGGIYCGYSSTPHLINVVINENYANYGGGIYLASANAYLTNVTISENNANNGGGIYCESSESYLVNCILWNDTPQEIYEYSGIVKATYSDIQDGWIGTGNIDADPLFADPENGNFHLTWANFPIPDSTKSPCIDAGDPNSPLDPDSTRADIGAYYFDQMQTDIENTSVVKVPINYRLYQNYPNPFNPKTIIQYSIPKDSRVELKIYNIKGELVRTLVNEPQSIGYYDVVWNGRDDNDIPVSSGVYFYRLKIGDKVSRCIGTKKCLLLK